MSTTARYLTTTFHVEYMLAYKQAQNMESRCTILFFDEIDALGQSRGSSAGISDQGGGGDGCSRRVLAELLIQMNRINSSSSSNKKSDFLEPEEDDHSQSSESGESVDTVYENEPSSYMEESDASIEDSGLRVRVIVVAATNRPEDCDPALVRRFSVRVMVGLPTQRDRKRILKQYLTGIDHNIPPKQLHEIALSTDGWSGSDLESLTREAAMAPVRECIRSAALIKRRIPQRERREGDSSCQNDDQAGAGNCPHIEARDKLLEQFRNLRQVNFQDFNEAISFWTGNHYQSSDSITNPSMDQTSSTKRMVHYDSSSDEED